MENTPAKLTFIETELKKFETEYEITEVSLQSLANKYKDLKVNGVDDKEGLKAVESARKELKNKRVEIEKVSKAMRDSAVKFQKAVIAREKDFVSIIEPEETRLEGIEDAIWEEKERIRLEEEKKESDRIQNMLDQLNELNYGIDFHALKGMTDEQFQETLKEAKEAYEERARQMAIELEKEKERVRQIEEAKRAEEAEIARIKAEQEKERKEIEKMQAEMKAAQEKLAIEQSKLQQALEEAAEEKKAIQDAKEAEEREKKRQAELEAARQEAAEKARIEAEQKAEREKQERAIAEEKARQAETERLEREKQEEEEKLLAGADSGKFERLQSLIEKNFLDENVIIWHNFKSKKGKTAASKVRELIKQANQICKENV